MTFQGELLAPDGSVLARVAGRMDTHTLPGGLKDTQGSFVVPAGVIIAAGNTLRLKLSDGTDLEILILRVMVGSGRPTVAEFSPQ